MKFQNIKKYQQKDSTWCLKLVTKQEITLSLLLYRVTKYPTEGEKIENASISFDRIRRPNWNQVQQNFPSCTIKANIWEKNERERHM